MLAQRVGSAVVAVPIILLLIVVGGWPYAAMAAVALGVAGAEFQHLRAPWRDLRVVAGAIAAAACAVAARGGVALPASLAFGGGVMIASMFVARERRDALEWLVAGTAYLGLLGCTFVLLRDADNGRDWVLLALLATFAVDTAAYFTGRAIGRHKMAPEISPKKTWEGFAGGWVGGIAAVVLLNYVLEIREGAATVVALGLLVPPAAAAGDLFESWLKRRAGVKDASALIPGHGGVLDRLDSLLFVVPVVWVVERAL